MKKLAALALVAILFGTIVSACGGSDSTSPRSDGEISKEIEKAYLRNQPIPRWTKSQLRASVIGIETAQVDAVVTTTFFFNQGVVDPIDTCSSVGLPIPSTMQLRNPPKIVTKNRTSHSDIVEVLPNMEPNGVYTGDSTGTYILCSAADGSIYASYWEGFVKTVTGPAEWDYTNHRSKMVGPSSVDFQKLLASAAKGN